MIGIAEIKQVIPHRGPILLVDRVLRVVPGQHLVARKAITGNEPCYVDLPDDAPKQRYAYPAGLLIESWAQAGVLLACWEQPNPDVLAGKVELAGAIHDVRLLRPAFPGDVLEHEVRMVRAVADAAIVSGRTRLVSERSSEAGDAAGVTAGEIICEVGRFVVALRPVDALRRTVR